MPEQSPILSENGRQNPIAMAGLFFLELIRVVLLAGLTIWLIRYFLFKPFYVKGQSMEPNFLEHDYLIIDELTYRWHPPERGDVIVLKAPTVEKDFYLKRIVGLPGERIKVENNHIIVYNEQHPLGVAVTESYINENTDGAISMSLGPDEYFVMGDNRNASFDSRRFGPVHRSSIIGRTWLRGWPPSRVAAFSAPQYNF